MSNLPAELKYASSHEWVRVESDGTAYVGITDHAQESMGDLVYVEQPEVDQAITAAEEAGVVESVKAASDIYAPVSGSIVSVNAKLEDEPELVNNDPYGDGWIFQIKISDAAELEKLMSAEEYATSIEDE